MPLSNVLTDTQKRILCEIVEIAKEHSCEDEYMIYSGSKTSTSLVWTRTRDAPNISVPNRAPLDSLVEEGLLRRSEEPTKSGGLTLLYSITHRAKSAVANDFDYPTHSEEQQGTIQVQAVTPPLDFSFVSSAENRAIIERDYEEVRSCVAANAHKATIVLCGGIIEALLIERLLENEEDAKAAAEKLKPGLEKRDIDRWFFQELIDVAADMGILSSDFKTMAYQIKDYRNVIHPGYEIRKSFELTHVKATAAVALVGLLVEELS